MKRFIHLSFACGAALVPASLVHAAFNPAIVPADSRWVVFLDLNTLRETALGKELLDIVAKGQPKLEAGGVRPDFQKILEAAGSATAFGNDLSGKPESIDGGLVLQGTADLRKIAEGFVAQATITTPADVTELKDLPFQAYSLKGGLFVAFPPEPVIIVSKSKAQLTKARDVFRGAAPSMAAKPPPLSAMLPKGGNHYLIAASIVPSAEGLFPTGGPQARILLMANSGSIALGEDGKMTVGRVQLDANSDDVADKLMKIVQGVIAIFSLTETTDQRLGEFLKSVTVDRVKTMVTVNMAYPSERLVQMIDSMQREHRERAVERAAPKAGTTIAEWTADQDLGNAGASAQTITTRTIENVHLANGSTITLGARRDAGENGRFDYVQIMPTAGSPAAAALLFEAEFMRLSRYRIEDAPFASGGKLIVLNEGSGTARFQFPGAEGTYVLKVGYVDESDGKGKFTVSVKDPEPPAAASAPDKAAE